MPPKSSAEVIRGLGKLLRAPRAGRWAVGVKLGWRIWGVGFRMVKNVGLLGFWGVAFRAYGVAWGFRVPCEG